MKNIFSTIAFSAVLLNHPTKAEDFESQEKSKIEISGIQNDVCKTAKNILECEIIWDKIIVDGWLELPLKLFQAYQEYQTILAEMKNEASEKIAKIDSTMEGVTDERKLKRWEKIKQMILTWVTKVDEWFQSLSTTKKMFTLEYLNAWLKFTDEKNKDNLLDNSIDAVHVTINEEWNDLTLNRIWANADYLINKWVPEDQVDEIFHEMLNVRLEESKVALEESKKRWDKLDNILAMQKQILEARDKFKKSDSYTPL